VSLLDELKDAVLCGDAKRARQLADRALGDGVDPGALLAGALVPAMARAGESFECGELFVPDLLVAARAMKGAFEPIRPQLASAGVPAAGRVVIGTVQGDVHDIGKNLVAAVLEGAGFDVVDLGADVPPARFVEAVSVHRPDIVALSALLSTTVTAMKDTIEALEAAGVRGRVRVIAGGAPVTEAFAREIGADGTSDNASAAVSLARALVRPQGV
jgi:5-methyltetrahydrofolate--homocysteine methyltransferase